MNRLFIALFLFLMTASAFASSSGISHDLINLTPEGSDYSVAYLSQIFGTMGGTLHTTSGQMLGHVFAIFNKGVMVAAALWLGYTTLSIVLHAAGDGSFVGQNRNVHLVLLRIAFGFALIIPSSTTGYSLLQDIFMKIVIAGVGLADDTWNAALTYMQYGGQLFIPPKQLSTDTNITQTAIIGSTKPGIPTTTPSQPVPILASVTQIFQNEVCMLKSSHWQKKLYPNSYPESYHPAFDAKKGWVYFPGITDSHDPKSRSDADSCGSAQNYYLSTKSPTLTYDKLAPKHTSPTASQAQKENIAYQALKQLVLSELPVAEDYVENGISSTDEYNVGAQGIFSSLVDYGNLITQYQTYFAMEAAPAEYTAAQIKANLKNTGDQCTAQEQRCVPRGGCHTVTVAVQCHETASEEMSAANLASWHQYLATGPVMSEAKGTGWIMAGAFYWNVEQANNIASTISISALFPVVTPPSVAAFTYWPGASGHDSGAYMVSAATVVMQFVDCTQTTLCTQGINTLWKQYVGAQQAEPTGTVDGNIGSAEGGSLQANVISDAIQDIVDANLTFNTAINYNPITELMDFGNKLIQAVGSMWEEAIILSAVAAGFAGICDSTSPGGVVIQAVLTWVKSIVMLLSSLLLGPGAILSFYVPLYPFAIFTCAAVGWLVMVIEGVAAAPLVCMGLTHPEGHDFLGKAEQALMLFLGIFLRPALMIIGLIASMVLSFVAFHMLITGYTGVIGSFATQSGVHLGEISGESNFSQFICGVLLMATFGIFTLEIIEQSYKLIYQLPNNIMTWIGGQRTGEDFGQMASQLKSGVSSTAGSLSQGGKGLDDANSGMVSGIAAAKKVADEDAEKMIEGG
ncbi:MAG: DotA/TraY family protein [Gammaproteobacteria bacterium]|nr:DotA/TraY family protein [Gammaproteobacteria bacterium]